MQKVRTDSMAVLWLSYDTVACTHALAIIHKRSTTTTNQQVWGQGLVIVWDSVFKRFLIFLIKCGVWECASVYRCLWRWWLAVGAGFPRAGGIDSCKSLDGCREVNVHSLCKARAPNCWDLASPQRHHRPKNKHPFLLCRHKLFSLQTQPIFCSTTF